MIYDNYTLCLHVFAFVFFFFVQPIILEKMKKKVY